MGGLKTWDNEYLDSVEIYNPVTGQWEEGPALNFSRAFHTGTLLRDGRLFVAGGENDFGTGILRSTEMLINNGTMDAGLILYFSFNSDEGGVASDQSGNGHTATVVNAVWTPAGCNGGAYRLDGSDDYLAVPDTGNPFDFGTNEFTLSGWMRIDGWSGPDQYHGLIGKFNTSADNYDGYVLGTKQVGSAAYPVMRWRTGGVDYDATYELNHADGQWHHYVGVRNAAGIWLYVDGVLRGWNTSPQTQTSEDNASALAIGSERTGGTWCVNGLLDEVRVYNRALRSDEVYTLYDNSQPRNRAPRVEGISVSLDEDTVMDISLAGSDADGDELTYSIVDSPTHGAVLLDGNVATYLPGANYHGSDTFTYRANDGMLDSNVGAVSLQIASVNDTPILQPIDDQVVNEGQTLGFSVMGVDVDGDALSYSMEDLPAGAQFDPVTQTFGWTPTYQQAGEYTLNCRVEDGQGGAATATIRIQVRHVNEPPVARLALTRVSGHTASLSAEGSSDPEGEALRYAWEFGDGASQSGQALRVSHSYRTAGEYTVRLTVTDAQGASSVATVKVWINNPPLISTPYVLPIFRQWCLFYASGYDTDGRITEYAWNSNRDGFLSRLPFFIKCLSRGQHTITVKAKDNLGAWSTEKAVTLYVN